MTYPRTLPTWTAPFLVAIPLILIWAGPSSAHDRWSVNNDATNCRACHGDFRATNYVSPSDGQSWGNLHNLHRYTMLSGDCDACHGSNDLPVRLATSLGGSGLAAISCMGCHGRAEDNGAGNPESPNGYGAGLRQHHFNAGVTVCLDCHQDADPANYTPVGEDVLPTYYANPGTNHPNMPTDACNEDGSENFAGASVGQDNDGDGVYDGADGDCAQTAVPGIVSADLVVTNFPNPFNPQTTIRFTLDRAESVRLSVYSVDGVLVRVLQTGDLPAGTHTQTWDGTDASGRPMTSGLYLCRLDTGSGSHSSPMMLVR